MFVIRTSRKHAWYVCLSKKSHRSQSGAWCQSATRQQAFKFHTRKEAMEALELLRGTPLDGKIVEIDYGED